MTTLSLGLIGAGAIGRCHALAMHAVGAVFPHCPLTVRRKVVAEATASGARAAAARLGFETGTDDWRVAVEEADAVIVAVPSALHKEVVSHAIAAGKPVLCEKPVGLGPQEAEDLAGLAARHGVVHAVGFTYVRAPVVQHARALLTSGEFGRVIHFRARHVEDYLADPGAPHSWRLSAALAGPFGALGDLGYHAIAVMRHLVGPFCALSGRVLTAHATRPDPTGAATRLPVQNEDYAAALIDCDNGAVGTIETSRLCGGRRMELSFEIVAEGGTLAFNAERLNELSLHRAGAEGFTTLLSDASHPHYGDFLSAPGHQIGFNDLKTIELFEFLSAIHHGRPAQPDLREAARISSICAAIHAASASGERVHHPETLHPLPLPRNQPKANP